MTDHLEHANFALLRDPLFLAARMRMPMCIFDLCALLLDSCSPSKIKGHREHAGSGLLRDPLFLAPRMHCVSAFFAFGMFLLNNCSLSKIKGRREHAGFGLLRDPLFLGPACVLYIRISFLGFRRVSDSQGINQLILAKGRGDGLRKGEQEEQSRSFGNRRGRRWRRNNSWSNNSINYSWVGGNWQLAGGGRQ